MRGIVSQTEAINKRVHDNISPRLYLFCNFDEGNGHWISEDGKFLYDVLILYKVMIDANYITGHARTILASGDSKRWKSIALTIQYDELQKLTDKINCFRTVEAHNVNERNGYFQKQTVEEYHRWVFSVINANIPSTEAHYKALNMELEKISIQCENCVTLFLDYVEQAPDKEDIVERWINAIINKYSQKEDYLYGQMADMYYSLYSLRTGHNVPKNVNKDQMRFILSNWLMNYYIEPFDKAEEIIEEEYRKKVEIVKSMEGRETIQKLAQQKKSSLNDQKERILRDICEWSHLQSADELRPKHYSHYFLEKTMPELVKKLLITHPEYSLLPQDILQLLIYTYLSELQF